jgi:hypothetical protein
VTFVQALTSPVPNFTYWLYNAKVMNACPGIG